MNDTSTVPNQPGSEQQKLTEYPLYFQSYMIQHVTQLIQAGECVSIVGAGTMGKTHFLQRLLDKNVQRAFLRQDAKDILFIRVDPNALLFFNQTVEDSKRAWTGFEIIGSRIFEAEAPRLDEPQSVKTSTEDGPVETDRMAIAKSYLNLVDDRTMAFRRLEKLVKILLKRCRKVKISFDEFELLFAQMPASFFTNLRALRDTHRYSLLFMATSRVELRNLSDSNKVRDTESFIELFRDVVYMRPASQQPYIDQNRTAHPSEAQLLLDNLNRRLRSNRPYSSELDQNILFNVTGCFRGLLRTSVQVLDTVVSNARLRYAPNTPNANQIITELLHHPDMARELHTLWESLTISEQELLQKISNNVEQKQFLEYDTQIISLYNKSIIKGTKTASYLIHPPLLQYYIQNRSQMERVLRRSELKAQQGANTEETKIEAPPTLPEVPLPPFQE